jgi:chemotaxis protein MotB
MTRTLLFLAVALAALAAGTGCVPYWAYAKAVKHAEDVKEINDGHQARHKDLERETKGAVAKAASLDIRNRELGEYVEGLERRLGQLGKLRKELEQAVKTGVQDAGLSEDVKITEDKKLSIAGDVLFLSGSADLTPKAKSILKKLAPVLIAQQDKAFFRIEGHTDTQPIVKAKKKFPTNWHLSVARAISVLVELKKLNVSEERMYAAGYGEWKPRVRNDGRKGAAGNRRVEIALIAERK